MITKLGTKYPQGYVKASEDDISSNEPQGDWAKGYHEGFKAGSRLESTFSYADKLAECIYWATNVSTQTALDLIHAVQLSADDLTYLGFSPEEYPELFDN